MLGARTAAWSGKALPYDAELKYLESTGTQYILFDESINGIDIEILPSDNNDYGAVGRWNGGSRCDTIGYTRFNGRGFYVKSARNISQVYLYDLEEKIRHITVHGEAVTIDGKSFNINGSWDSALFALFGCYNWSTKVVDALSCKIGSCKLYFDDVLVFDFAPVRVGSVGYMYDRVSGQLFGNAGTGSFIIGPDKTT